MADFVMPSLGADMDAGTLVSWRKRPGDRVERGEVLAEVETDKGIIEVEAFATGVLEEVLVEPVTQVPVGTVLARIRESAGKTRDPGTGPGPGTRSSEPDPDPELEPAPASGPVLQSAHPELVLRQAQDERRDGLRDTLPEPEPGAERVRSSPRARRLARELGVDLATVRASGPEGAVVARDVQLAARAGTPGAARRASPSARALARERDVDLATVPGTGKHGAITRGDVERAAATAAPKAPDDPGARMRRAIARAMARSKREIPHYYLSQTIDLEPALSWLEARNADLPPDQRLLAGVLLIKAVALALRRFPELNAVWQDDAVRPLPSIHVGAAVALRGGGLIAPAIHRTDQLALPDLMSALSDVVARARRGQLLSSEVTGATITVTSLGDRGVEAVYGVINPPQVAIVGFGKVSQRPWVREGKVVPARVVTATLAADHRASDGHRGALFLNAIDKLLQEPESL